LSAGDDRGELFVLLGVVGVRLSCLDNTRGVLSVLLVGTEETEATIILVEEEETVFAVDCC
jgi:hypothetical protein